MSKATVQFPSRGRSKAEVLSAMQSARQRDVRWQDGKAFSLVYYAGEEVADLVGAIYQNEALAAETYFIHGGLRLGSRG